MEYEVDEREVYGRGWDAAMDTVVAYAMSMMSDEYREQFEPDTEEVYRDGWCDGFIRAWNTQARAKAE